MRWTGVAGAVGAAMALAAAPGGAGAQVLHIHDTSNNLGTVNVVTGEVDVIGNLGFDQITDIGFDPDGNLYGISFSSLYRIDRRTAGVERVGLHGISGGNALVFGTDGTLYGAGNGSTDLFRIDPSTGASTSLGTIGYSSAGDLAFNAGSLYLSSTTDELIRISFGSTVIGTAVGAFGSEFTNVFGLATAANGRLYGVSGTRIFTTDVLTGDGSLALDYRGAGLGAAFGTSFVTEALPSDPSVVPEPATVVLVGVGAAALALTARRRRTP